MATTQTYAPLLMTIEQFADLNGISPSTVRKCIAGKSESYPPLRAKKSKGKRFVTYITCEAAAEWRANLQDA